MNIPQTVYNQFPPVGIDGQFYGSGVRDVWSALGNVAIDAGMGVITGAAFDQCTLPGQASDITGGAFKGIALLTELKEPIGPIGGPLLARYKIGDAVPILKKGRIYVLPQGDLVTDGQLFCVYTGAGVIGRFRGNNTNAALVPNAKVLQGATVASGLVALIEIEGI